MALKDAPTLLNLKLGMTVDQVNSVIGRDLKVKVKRKGEKTFLKNFVKKEPRRSLKGIRSIFLSFYDGVLYEIELFYRKGQPWNDLGSMLKHHSRMTGFPGSFWEVRYGYAKAICSGFSLKADMVLNPHIQITDSATEERVRTERKKGK